MRAIIAGEQDERVLVQFVFLRCLASDLADSGVEPSNHGGLVALRARPFFAAVREVRELPSITGLLGKLIVRVRGSVRPVKEERTVMFVPVGLNADSV